MPSLGINVGFLVSIHSERGVKCSEERKDNEKPDRGLPSLMPHNPTTLTGAPLSTLGTSSGHCARTPGLGTRAPGRAAVRNPSTSPGVPSMGLAAERPPQISANGTGSSWGWHREGVPSTLQGQAPKADAWWQLPLSPPNQPLYLLTQNGPPYCRLSLGQLQKVFAGNNNNKKYIRVTETQQIFT